MNGSELLTSRHWVFHVSSLCFFIIPQARISLWVICSYGDSPQRLRECLPERKDAQPPMSSPSHTHGAQDIRQARCKFYYTQAAPYLARLITAFSCNEDKSQAASQGLGGPRGTELPPACRNSSFCSLISSKCQV